jgi:hypothetical protein
MTTTTNALNAQIIADLTGSGSAGYIDCSPCQEGERFRIFQRTIPTSGLTIDIEFGVDGELFELTISDIEGGTTASIVENRLNSSARPYTYFGLGRFNPLSQFVALGNGIGRKLILAKKDSIGLFDFNSSTSRALTPIASPIEVRGDVTSINDDFYVTTTNGP